MAIEIERVTLQATADGRLTPTQAAQYLSVSMRTLATWRHLKRGPGYLKRPGISYRIDELNRWLRDGEVHPES